MIRILLEAFIYNKLKKEIFQLEEENKKLQKELKQLKEQNKKLSKFREKFEKEHQKSNKLQAELKNFLNLLNIDVNVGELYVVNVCALFVVSKEKVLLTGSRSKLLTETKKMKYRPIVITNIDLPQVNVIALSTDREYNSVLKKTEFKISYCKFETNKCFIKKIENDSFIFEKTVIRRSKGKVNKITKKEIPIPISIFKYLKDINSFPSKEKVFNICELSKNYELIKKCANCDKDYINKILKEIEG